LFSCQDYESSAASSVENDAEADETQNHMQTASVLETLNLAASLVLPPGETF